MIRTQCLLRLVHELLDADHETGMEADKTEIRQIIYDFFTTDKEVIGTENEGKVHAYYESIRDMLFQTAQQIDELWEETDPENHTPFF